MSSSAALMRMMKPEEVHESFLFELKGFSAGGALPKEAVELWHREAPELCIGYYEDDRLVARICGTQSSEARYTNSCIYSHEPQGTMVGIHSLVVEQDRRGKGIGTALLKRYLQLIEENLNKVNRVTLVCRERVILYYENRGFQSKGLAEVKVADGTPLFEMECSILRSGNSLF